MAHRPMIGRADGQMRGLGTVTRGRPEISYEEMARRTGGAIRELTLPDGSLSLRLLRFLGCAGITGFVVAVLALHVLQPTLNPAEHTISEYALGNDGWLMRSAFFALGVGTLATAAAIRMRYEPSALRGIGLALLTGTAIGLFIDSGYNTDHPHVLATSDGTIHGIGTWILALALPAAALTLGSSFVRTWASTLRARELQALGAAQLLATFVFEISPNAYRGLAERIVTLLAVVTLARLQASTAPVSECAQPRAGFRSPRNQERR
jgi:hypothetical protein